MQPSLEPADVTCPTSSMLSTREVNEKSVILGYFNPKNYYFCSLNHQE